MRLSWLKLAQLVLEAGCLVVDGLHGLLQRRQGLGAGFELGDDAAHAAVEVVLELARPWCRRPWGRGDQLVLGLGQLLDLTGQRPQREAGRGLVEGGDLVGHLGPRGLRLLQGGLLLLVAGEDRRADRDRALDAALDEVAGEDVGDGLVGQLGGELVGGGGERLHAGLALQQALTKVLAKSIAVSRPSLMALLTRIAAASLEASAAGTSLP
jgi:hypothetical protein